METSFSATFWKSIFAAWLVGSLASIALWFTYISFFEGLEKGILFIFHWGWIVFYGIFFVQVLVMCLCMHKISGAKSNPLKYGLVFGFLALIPILFYEIYPGISLFMPNKDVRLLAFQILSAFFVFSISAMIFAKLDDNAS